MYVCVCVVETILDLVFLYAGDKVSGCLGNVVGTVHDEAFVVGQVRLSGVALLVQLVGGLV